jgi:hypothetical protein
LDKILIDGKTYEPQALRKLIVLKKKVNSFKIAERTSRVGQRSLVRINFGASDVVQKVQQLVSKVITGSRNIQMTVDSVLALQRRELFAKIDKQTLSAE